MSHQDIIEFNEHLIKCCANYDIIEYIKRINNLYKEPLDISFMEELISFIEQDTCCIPHTLLIKYGVFGERNASANIKNTLELYDMIESDDFRLLNVQESDPKGGCTHKNIYYLHPNTFKLLLMRSKCEKKYAKYYILLEKCIKYYHDYQIRYKEYIITQKDDKIDKLTKKIDNQSQEIKNQSQEIKELLQYAKDSNDKLSNIEDELIETSTNLESTMLDMSIIQDKLDIAVVDRAIKPNNSNKINQVLILKSINDNNRLYISCGQKRHIQKTITVKKYNTSVLELIDGVPNSIYLFDHIKNNFNKNSGKEINIINRDIYLLSITEYDFIDRVKSLFDGRLNIDLTKRP